MKLKGQIKIAQTEPTIKERYLDTSMIQISSSSQSEHRLQLDTYTQLTAHRRNSIAINTVKQTKSFLNSESQFSKIISTIKIKEYTFKGIPLLQRMRAD